MLCAQFFFHVLSSLHAYSVHCTCSSECFWLLDCVFSCKNIAEMTLFSMHINRPSSVIRNGIPSIGVNASVPIVFRFNFIQQDFHRIFSCVCVCLFFLKHRYHTQFEGSFNMQLNIVSTCVVQCAPYCILHFHFFTWLFCIFFFEFWFLFYSVQRALIYIDLCAFKHTTCTHTLARDR